MAEENSKSITSQCWIVVIRILRFFMLTTLYPNRLLMSDQKKKTMLGNVDHFIDLLEALDREKQTLEQSSQEMMKIIASCTGDPSVGIFGCDLVSQIPKTILEDDQGNESRELMRLQYAEFAALVFDEAPIVWFSDECPDCQKIRVENECQNESCVSYRKKLQNL